MDQNQLNSLDPKLREAYQKVMGTQTPQTSMNQQTSELTVEDKQTNPATQTFSPEPPTPHAEPTVDVPQKPVDVQAPSVPPQQTTKTPNQGIFTSGTPQVTTAGTQTFLAEDVAGAKQSLKMIQLLYIAGGIIFFVVYALFWMKFFQITPSF